MKKHFLSFILLALTLGWSANVLAGGTVYFKNTLGWSKVYVIIFNKNAWKPDSEHNSPRVYPKTAGVDNGNYGEMTLEGDNIYKFDYSTNKQWIAFTSSDMHDWNDFNKNAACYRSDFNTSSPLFTPNTTESSTDNETKYYNNGSWSTSTPPAPDPCANCKTITK